MKRALNDRRCAETARPLPPSRCVSIEPLPYISTSISGKAGFILGGKDQPLMAPKKQVKATRNVTSPPSIQPFTKREQFASFKKYAIATAVRNANSARNSAPSQTQSSRE